MRRRNNAGMSLKHVRAALPALVLWSWFVVSVTGWPTATAGPSPTRRHESSAITSIPEAKDVKRDKSPRPVHLNLHRLPPSPANLLKPDGFQFYAYNEKGEMITRQMTMQEIQSLIAGGGPDHSNGEVQEPQKAEDILTGGKKVMDVVEKVQNVLKSAMDKPLSASLTGSQPMIPEKANVEWSNILPAILAGDKYGNKVEEATTDPLSVPAAIQNSDSSKLDANETEQPEAAAAVTKYYAEENASTSSVASETAGTSYTEKLMIPVSVITTERSAEQTTRQHTVQSTVFNKTTRPVPSSYQNITDEYSNREGSAPADNTGEIKWTTIDAILPSSSISSTKTKNETFDTDAKANLTSTTMNDIKVPAKTERTPSVVETSVTGEPTDTIDSSTESAADKGNASSMGPDAKPSGEEPFKPLSTELINSLSSVINQVSEKVSTVPLPTDDEQIRFGTVALGESEDRRNSNVSDVTPSATETVVSSTIHEETGDSRNVTAATIEEEEEEEESSSTTVESSGDEKMQTTPVAILSSDPTPQNHSTFLFNETKTPISNAANVNYSSTIVTIENMLETASTETNLPATESLVLPNNFENFSASTLASSLIAGSSLSPNKTHTTPVDGQSNSTKITSKLPLLANNANDTVTENPAIETGQVPSKKDEGLSQKEVENATDTRNSSVVPTTSSTESYSERDQVQSTLSESTTGTSNTTLSSDNTVTATAEPTLFEITSTNASTVDRPASSSEKPEEKTELRVAEQNVSSNANKSVTEGSDAPLQKLEENVLRIDSETVPTLDETRNASRIASKEESTTTERTEESTYRATTDGNVTLTTASAEKSNATKETQQAVDSSSTAASNLNGTKSGHGGITEEVPKVTSPANEDIKYSTNATTPAPNSITTESKEGNETRSVTAATNTTNESGNKTKDSSPEHEGIRIGANASMEIPTTTEMARGNETVAETTASSDSNGANTSSHGWQEISLEHTTSSSPLTSTRIASATASSVSTDPGKQSTVSLAASQSIAGLDTSTRNATADVVNFARLCNEIAIRFWISTNKGLSAGRSLVVSPFGMTSLLAMIFLGARGSTSEQMNELLGLDNVATFNPHLIFQNVTDTVSLARNQGIANAAFVRELFADKAKVRKLLPFYKEQAQQFYEGLVTEVNFATISDLARRRTNLLIRKQTGGRIKDFVKSNAVPLRSPLAAISANVFQTDCNTSVTSIAGRDGELYFAVSSAHRLRKLVPVPATVWRSNVLAGYEPSLDATAIALGGVEKIVSTIFILPGQQGHAAPGDTLDRLEQRLVNAAFRDGAWDKLLKVLIPRTGLELQIPKFSHRSVINATAALKRMGLDQLFSSQADFKGINGIGNRLFLSDVLQMNLFSTCGDEYIANGRHHVEIYPASPALRSSRRDDEELRFDNRISRTIEETASAARNIDKSEDRPRLKLDQPFLYFVRHNPTGFILHMGRFNPRLM